MNFFQFRILIEEYLTEDKISDLKKQNPDMSGAIDTYAAHDPTSTKKFLPWMVSQHKKGNVHPEHTGIKDTLHGFVDYQFKHGIKDHSQHDYGDIESAVKPHLGTPKTRKESEAHTLQHGLEKIHDDGNTQTFHVKTKEAAQLKYGGGAGNGKYGTGWCVAARSMNNLFNQHYGPMYTVHNKDDPNSPYAVHPERKIVTTRHNDGDKPYDTHPQIKDAIDAAHQYYKKQAEADGELEDHLYDHLGSGGADPKKIDAGLAHTNFDMRWIAAKQRDLSPEQLEKVLSDPHHEIRELGINHRNISMERLHQAFMNPNETYRNKMSIASRPNLLPKTIKAALEEDPEKYVRHQHIPAVLALKANGVTPAHLNIALKHADPRVKSAATKHPALTSDQMDHIAKHGDFSQKEDLLANPNITPQHLHHIFDNGDPYIRSYAARHPKADSDLLMKAAQDSSEDVQHGVPYHHNTNEEHLTQLARSQHPQVLSGVVAHDKVTPNALHHVINNKNASDKTRMSAIMHKNMQPEDLHKVLDSNPSVSHMIAAATSPKADASVMHRVANHPDIASDKDLSEYIKMRQRHLENK